MARRKAERPAERGARRGETDAVAAYLTALPAPKVPAPELVCVPSAAVALTTALASRRVGSDRLPLALLAQVGPTAGLTATGPRSLGGSQS
jgi:hypothetical protein